MPFDDSPLDAKIRDLGQAESKLADIQAQLRKIQRKLAELVSLKVEVIKLDGTKAIADEKIRINEHTDKPYTDKERLDISTIYMQKADELIAKINSIT